MKFQKSYWTKFCKNVAFCNSAVEIFRVLFIPTLREGWGGASGAQAPSIFWLVSNRGGGYFVPTKNFEPPPSLPDF